MSEEADPEAADALGAAWLGSSDRSRGARGITAGLSHPRPAGSALTCGSAVGTAKKEVLAQRDVLRRLAEEHGLGRPRVGASGTVVVHSGDPGYRAVRQFATAAAGVVGAWVNVITDDAPAARDEFAPL